MSEESKLIDSDPRLKELAYKIDKLLEEYSAAGSYQLASSTHSEFGVKFPVWSAIQFEEANGLCVGFRIKSSAKKDGREHLASSMHLLLSTRDMLVEQAAFFITMSDQAVATLKANGVEIEHTPLQKLKEKFGSPEELPT